MCYERYKGYLCAHMDPQSTPTALRRCEEFSATGRCAQGRKYVIVAEQITQTPCPGCQQLECQLIDAIGSLDKGQEDAATWKLWYRIGWPCRDAMLVEIFSVRGWICHVMSRWEGPYHNHQIIIIKWIAIFEEFKGWLYERLEKRDAQGRLYFPPGEEKDVRIEKKKVLQHLVRWILANMTKGLFDKLDTALFGKGLDMAFDNLIYEWDTHYSEEPGYDCAKKEFTKYWTTWSG